MRSSQCDVVCTSLNGVNSDVLHRGPHAGWAHLCFNPHQKEARASNHSRNRTRHASSSVYEERQTLEHAILRYVFEIAMPIAFSSWEGHASTTVYRG